MILSVAYIISAEFCGEIGFKHAAGSAGVLLSC